MILREIYIYPGIRDYPDEIERNYRDKSRALCNFVERRLKKLKFKTDGFKRICFILRMTPGNVCFVNSSGVLVVEIGFQPQDYTFTTDKQHHDFFITKLLEGLTKCSDQFKVPANEIISEAESFRKNGYSNSWVYKSKSIKILGIKSSMHCKLTLHEFLLMLTVSKDGVEVFDEVLLRDRPDEIIYLSYLKDFRFDGEGVVRQDMFGKVLFEIYYKDL